LTRKIALTLTTLVALILGVAAIAYALDTKIEAETFTVTSGSSVLAKADSAASGGQRMSYGTNGSAQTTFSGAATNVLLQMKGTVCGSPNATADVKVDGVLKGSIVTTDNTYRPYNLPLSGLGSGSHTLAVEFNNDFNDGTCDRNLHLDFVTISTPDSPPPPPPENSVTFVGAGDIATSSNNDAATADLIDARPNATAFALGDLAYDTGTLSEFQNYYGPDWGQFAHRTIMVPGNHEYDNALGNAQGYYDYFGFIAGERSKGYYSRDLGQWHVLALNSNPEVGYAAGSPQQQWLADDLARNSAAKTGSPCQVALSHHPRFSSGSHGSDPAQAPFWDTLQAGGVDIVLNGHDHHYERFAKQLPNGTADPNGIREFVVGTGGVGPTALGTVKANSEVRITNTRGVLELKLAPTSYSWKFIDTTGTVQDSGSDTCH
jgi:hypothetical protein